MGKEARQVRICHNLTVVDGTCSPQAHGCGDDVSDPNDVHLKALLVNLEPAKKKMPSKGPFTSLPNLGFSDSFFSGNFCKKLPDAFLSELRSPEKAFLKDGAQILEA